MTTWAQRLGYPPPPRVASLDLREALPRRHARSTPPATASRRPVATGRAPQRRSSGLGRSAPIGARSASRCPEANRYALHPLGAQAPPYLGGRSPGETGARDAHRRRAGAPVRASPTDSCRRSRRPGADRLRRELDRRVPTIRWRGARARPSGAAVSWRRTARQCPGPRCASAACHRERPPPRHPRPARRSSTWRAATSSWAAASARRCARPGTARRPARLGAWPPTATPIPRRA